MSPCSWRVGAAGSSGCVQVSGAATTSQLKRSCSDGRSSVESEPSSSAFELGRYRVWFGGETTATGGRLTRGAEETDRDTRSISYAHMATDRQTKQRTFMYTVTKTEACRCYEPMVMH